MKPKSQVLVYILSVITSLLLIGAGGVVNQVFLPAVVVQGSDLTETPTATATTIPTPTATPTAIVPSGFTYNDQPTIVYAKWFDNFNFSAPPGRVVEFGSPVPSDFINAPVVLNAWDAGYHARLLGVVIGPAVPVGPIGNQRLEPREGTVQPGDYMAVIVKGLAKVRSIEFCGYLPGGTVTTGLGTVGYDRSGGSSGSCGDIRNPKAYSIDLPPPYYGATRFNGAATVLGVLLEPIVELGPEFVWVYVEQSPGYLYP